MKPAVIVLSFSLILAGCGGRAPNPILVRQPGDQKLSCSAIEWQLDHMYRVMAQLAPHTDKTMQNMALGVAGYFFIFPVFLMDLRNAEATEYKSYQKRFRHLDRLRSAKGCNQPAQTTAEAPPAALAIEPIKVTAEPLDREALRAVLAEPAAATGDEVNAEAPIPGPAAVEDGADGAAALTGQS